MAPSQPAPRTATNTLKRLLDAFHAQKPIRAGSLIVTLFGDAIVPRGGTLSLASIAAVMRACRIGEGLVRTAMSRLVQEGLFERISVGRFSFFRLSARGNALFADAAAKIYGEPRQEWNGFLTLALFDAPERQALRNKLAPDGFVQLTPDLMVAVAPRIAAPSGVLFLSVKPEADAARRLASKAWPLDVLAGRYAGFKEKFSSLLGGPATTLVGLDALVARMLLIHDYRRIVLRDPMLPQALLPEAWEGAEARALCTALYAALVPNSEAWLSHHATTIGGLLPAPGRDPLRRFR